MSLLTQFYPGPGGGGGGGGYGSAGNLTGINSLSSQTTSGQNTGLLFEVVTGTGGQLSVALSADYVYSADGGTTWSASRSFTFNSNPITAQNLEWAPNAACAMDPSSGKVFITGGSIRANVKWFYASNYNNFVEYLNSNVLLTSLSSMDPCQVVGVHWLAGRIGIVGWDVANQQAVKIAHTNNPTVFTGWSFTTSNLNNAFMNTSQRGQDAVYVAYTNGSNDLVIGKAGAGGWSTYAATFKTLAAFSTCQVVAGGVGTLNGLLVGGDAGLRYTTDEWTTVTASTITLAAGETSVKGLWSEPSQKFYIQTSLGNVFVSTDATGSAFIPYAIPEFVPGSQFAFGSSSLNSGSWFVKPPSIPDYGYFYGIGL
jgi:hypothetical protein